MRRFLATTCIAATVAGGAAAAVAVGQSADETVVVNSEGLFLVVRGGPADNTLSVSLDKPASQYVIESNVRVAAMNSCEATTAYEARCDHFVGYGVGMSIQGRRGDDRLSVLTAGHPAGVNGGPGADRIKTTIGRNTLSGDEGDDRISAGAGNDRLSGYIGRDTLRAGAGNDRLFADDERKDRLVDCGGGDGDVAHLDAGLDPEPIGCERVVEK